MTVSANMASGADDAATPVALSAPLDGLRLIEASAGTGKTWTLSGLYLRLILERGLNPESILTVTFTKAATAELRDRIRARLQQMQDLIEGRGTEADSLCQALLVRLPDRDLALRRLRAALRGIDQAAIYTIHAFCQRVLSDRAFSSGMVFQNDIVPDVGELRRQIVLDFWRRRIAPSTASQHVPPALFLGWLESHGLDVDALARWAASLATRPRLHIRPSPTPVDLKEPIAAFVAHRQRAADVFAQQRDAFTQWLATAPGLKRASYRAGDVAKRLNDIAHYFAQPDVIALPKKAESLLPEALSRNSTGDPPTHAVLDALASLDAAARQLQQQFARAWRALRLDLLVYLRDELPLRLQARREQSYDDLLLGLQRALHGERGETLADELRQQYPAAMIDEFQDTDPLQWDIVRRIWADGVAAGQPLCAFLVGDPKQAIYSFRGADIHAYLQARKACGHRHALTENQRSVSGYLQALNHLYEACDDPFLNPDIQYQPVVASLRRKPALIDGGLVEPSPLRLMALLSDDGKLLSNGAGERWASTTTAAEIADLLQRAADGKLEYDGRPLRAGDIAVLVRSHFQSRQLRDELARLGIGCAEQASDNVWASTEAEDLERLLSAVASPHRGGTLRAALLGRFWGWTLPRVIATEQQEGAWDQLLGEFDHYRMLWRDRGFMRMLRELLRRRGVIERLAALDDGERSLTNLFHLAELLQAERHRLHGIEAQLRWLAQCRRDALGNRAEESQLRLESDAGLVQVLTIHASKGLEYPVVFLPYLWSGKDRQADEDLIAYHDADGALCIDADPDDIDAIRAQALDESRAEDLRLAYVALTRAKNRCYLFTGDFSSRPLSAVGHLLHSRGEPTSACLQQLAQAPGDVIRYQAAPTAQRRAAHHDDPARLDSRTLQRPIPAAQIVTSYTGLSRQIDEPLAEAMPDHDQHPSSAEPAPLRIARSPGGGRFSFPRGAAPGTCLHAVLERIDLSADPVSWRAVAEAQLRASGMPAEWADELCQWLAEVALAPLTCPSSGKPLQLSQVDPQRRLIELAFHLPLRQADIARVVMLAREHGLQVSSLAPLRLDGYLRGFIDLVFEHQGRWYVADYKSNWLGDSVAEYDADAVSAAMDDGDYHLQYLLYTVALHRWLKWRIDGYHYERDMGGVLYLFLRGIDAQGLGIYASRPPLALVSAIDRLLAGEPEPA